MSYRNTNPNKSSMPPIAGTRSGSRVSNAHSPSKRHAFYPRDSVGSVIFGSKSSATASGARPATTSTSSVAGGGGVAPSPGSSGASSSAAARRAALARASAADARGARRVGLQSASSVSGGRRESPRRGSLSRSSSQAELGAGAGRAVRFNATSPMPPPRRAASPVQRRNTPTPLSASLSMGEGMRLPALDGSDPSPVVLEAVQVLQMKLMREAQARQALELKLFDLQSSFEERLGQWQHEQSKTSWAVTRLREEMQSGSTESLIRALRSEVEADARTTRDAVAALLSKQQSMSGDMQSLRDSVAALKQEVLSSAGVSSRVEAQQQMIESKMAKMDEALVAVQRMTLQQSQRVKSGWLHDFLEDREQHQSKFIEQRMSEIEHSLQRAIRDREASEEQALAHHKSRWNKIVAALENEAQARKADLKRLHQSVQEAITHTERKIKTTATKLAAQAQSIENDASQGISFLRKAIKQQGKQTREDLRSVQNRMQTTEDTLRAEIRARMQSEERVAEWQSTLDSRAVALSQQLHQKVMQQAKGMETRVDAKVERSIVVLEEQVKDLKEQVVVDEGKMATLEQLIQIGQSTFAKEHVDHIEEEVGAVLGQIVEHVALESMVEMACKDTYTRATMHADARVDIVEKTVRGLQANHAEMSATLAPDSLAKTFLERTRAELFPKEQQEEQAHLRENVQDCLERLEAVAATDAELQTRVGSIEAGLSEVRKDVEESRPDAQATAEALKSLATRTETEALRGEVQMLSRALNLVEQKAARDVVDLSMRVSRSEENLAAGGGGAGGGKELEARIEKQIDHKLVPVSQRVLDLAERVQQSERKTESLDRLCQLDRQSIESHGQRLEKQDVRLDEITAQVEELEGKLAEPVGFGKRSRSNLSEKVKAVEEEEEEEQEEEQEEEEQEPESEAEQVEAATMDEFDKNADGTLDRAEFDAMLKQLPKSVVGGEEEVDGEEEAEEQPEPAEEQPADTPEPPADTPEPPAPAPEPAKAAPPPEPTKETPPPERPQRAQAKQDTPPDKQPAMPSENTSSNQPPPDLTDFDANNDGVLDRQEFEAMVGSMSGGNADKPESPS